MEQEELLKQLAASDARQAQILELLAAQQGVHLKATPALAGNFTTIFQPGGIFSVPGTNRDVFTAMVRKVGGLINDLPLLPGNEDNPRFATLTGYTGTSGDRPDYPCDDSPRGYVKGCYLTARFGRDSQDTGTIEWDQVKRKANRGVFDDLILHGRVLGLTDINIREINEDQLLNVITMSEMIGAAVQMERDLVDQSWQGNPVVQTANGGYKQFPGLDLQIATGQVDAENNVACPALDSDVKDFNYNWVCGTNPSIVTYVSMLEWYIRHNATRMGFDPAAWKFYMRPDLWFELTACWPCQYNTNRCASSIVGSAAMTVMGDEMVRQRDQMRQSMTIQINGRTYPVGVDDGIHEEVAGDNAILLPGEYASSIYMVPLTVTGGFPVTYREHVDYRLGGDDLNYLRGLAEFWTDGGVYSWALEQIKWCYKLSVKTEQRIVLRTPQIAGRIDHVRYSPLQHLREPEPDSPYYADGGVSVRPGGLPGYAVWLP